MTEKIEQMNIVIVGHVDHGKSTVIGRLLADTNSLPEGKLAQVKATCEQNAKPFEYAFLLDALKDEQAQGITIDVARCFFKTKKRRYIIIDAPGHIEFLKNMITGAARAEAGLLIIDAHEGVQENSRRHGYMLSLLGIKQIVVLVNKMDLENYSQDRFEAIKKEYTAFLKEINVTPLDFVPISAFNGDTITALSGKMPWYTGKPVVDWIDTFKKANSKVDSPLRFPIQDIYKFTQESDDRRLFAGTIETGTLSVGDDIIFLPSEKTSTIKSIESFNTVEKMRAESGQAIGVTLDTQVYVKRGEMMCKLNNQPATVAHTFKANIFWLGKTPLIKGKKVKIKCAGFRGSVYLERIITVIDASDLSSQQDKNHIDRHDVAECVFKLSAPMPFDCASDMESTSRFVIVDNYEIAGGGIITKPLFEEESYLDNYITKRDKNWISSNIDPIDRVNAYNQIPRFIVITGDVQDQLITVAKHLEEALFNNKKIVTYFGQKNMLSSLSSDMKFRLEDKDELIRRLAEVAHVFTKAGLIFISTIKNCDSDDVTTINKLVAPNTVFVVNISESQQIEAPNVMQVSPDEKNETLVKTIVSSLELL